MQNAALATGQNTAISAALTHETATAIGAAYADNTERAYATALAAFQDAGHAIPAAPEDVANYLVQLAAAGKSVASVRLAASAISKAHTVAGFDSPTRSETVRLAIKGLACQHGQPQIQASALDAAALDVIRATAMLPRTVRRGVPETPDYAAWRGQVDIALCSVLGDAGLRRSEAAALIWSDVELAGDGSGRITIVRSKTDQEGEGETVAITASTVQALEAVRNGAGDDPVFGMSESTIARRVKAAAAAAGLGDQFSGHSGRVGLAQRMTAAGAPAQAVLVQGRWKNAGRGCEPGAVGAASCSAAVPFQSILPGRPTTVCRACLSVPSTNVLEENVNPWEFGT